MQFFPEPHQSSSKPWAPTNAPITPPEALLPTNDHGQRGYFQSLLQANVATDRSKPKAASQSPLRSRELNKLPQENTKQVEAKPPAYRANAEQNRGSSSNSKQVTSPNRDEFTPKQQREESKPLSAASDQTSPARSSRPQVQQENTETQASEKVQILSAQPQKLPQIDHEQAYSDQDPELILHPLVMNNAFIQNALAADDAQEFMASQQTIASWMQQLDLPEHKQQAFLEQSGLLADQKISAHELFASMSLNPQNIRNEIQQLQNQIPIEGLAPHMERAEALHQGKLESEKLQQPQTAETELLSERAAESKSVETKAPIASHDPFQSVRHDWDQSSVKKYQVGTSQDSPAWINQLGDQMLETSPADMSTAESSLSPELVEGTVVPDYTGSKGPAVVSQAWQAPQDIDARELTFYQLSQEGFQPVAGEGLGSQDKNPDSQPESKHFSQGLAANLGAVVGNQTSERGTWESNLQRPELQRFRQEIIQRAEMLIKDGGGSIKLDLGHEQLGKIDLAIELKDQKLDIRIVAATERAREILAQELPRLREALASQNIDLQNLEIGLRQESSWSQSFEDGRHQQRQSWQEQQESQNGPWQLSRNEQVIREQSWGPLRPQHQGQIQIRV